MRFEIKHRLLLLLFVFVLNSYSQNPDISLLKSINAKNYPAWDNGMRFVSNSVYGLMPLSFACTMSYGLLKKDPQMIRNGYRSAATILLAGGITTGLKYVVNRSRPFVTYEKDIVQRDKNVGPYSFPSGHTTFAFATATHLSLTYKKWYVVIPSYIYASLVGYSRMRLGVHYPSDVLAGAILGAGSGLLVWKLDAYWLKKKSSK